MSAASRGRRALSNPSRGLLAMLLLGVVLDGALWLYLHVRMDTLPDVLPIHFNSAGQVDRIDLRTQLYLLPVIGLLTWIGNGVLGLWLQRWDEQLPYVVAAVTIVVQLLLIAAALNLVD